MSESVQRIPAFGPGAKEMLPRLAARPTTREWVRHSVLFALTYLTALWAGVALLFPYGDVTLVAPPDPASFVDILLYIPRYFFLELSTIGSYALAHPALIADGAVYALALLTILLAHECGHYIACRIYGVDASLPFFIPMPQPFLFGTLGAFIKIKSPIPSRRALFDIGIAGPLAGFVMLVPIAIAGLMTAAPQAPLSSDAFVIRFNDALLMQLVAGILQTDLAHIAPNPFYFAAWLGLLVTSLNLLPVGQLDGGHAVYALFRRRAHRIISLISFVFALVLVPLSWIFHGAPTGLIYTIVLFVMLRVGHPQPVDESEGIGRARILVALLTLLVFLLSFLPFPLTVGRV
jgi:membrane-associated protease RseP (regulator of RpoE activity)